MVKLTYRFLDAPFREDAVSSVRKVFNEDLGKSVFYRVFANFKSSNGRLYGLFPMIYDTGAIISLLPLRMFRLLGVKRYSVTSLRGITAKPELKVRLCKLTITLQDEEGNISPEFSIWCAIAKRDDVPFILGMKDIATKHSFTTDFVKRKFSLDFP